MTKTQILALLAARFGERTDLGAQTLTEMDYVQAFELEQNDWLPWFLLEVDSAALVISGAGNAAITLPSNFLIEAEDEILEYQTTAGTWKEIPKGSLARMKTLQRDPGPPLGFALRGNVLELYPAPDQVYPLRWSFFASDEIPSTALAGDTNLWMTYAADVLLAATGKRVAQQLQEAEIFGLFDTDLTASWNRLYTKHIARMEQNRSRVMGDE